MCLQLEHFLAIYFHNSNYFLQCLMFQDSNKKYCDLSAGDTILFVMKQSEEAIVS